MKKLNFPKIQRKLYIVAGILLAVLILAFTAPFQVFARAATIDTKLLLIVEDSSDTVLPNDELSEFIVVKTVSEISNSDKSHIAYAVSKSIAYDEFVNSILKYTFNNCDARIYIYGDLTISEFKSILNIDTYSIQTDIYDAGGITGKKANMSFGEEQEDNKIEQIICLSKNPNYQSLIVSAPDAKQIELETIIAHHYADTFVNPLFRATIVQNAFNYRTYPNFYGASAAPIDSAYLNVDYYLYKIEDETVPDYDYFAIRVNVNPICENSALKLSCEEFQVKFILPFTSDHFFEYGPQSSSKAKNINVTLGYGQSSGVSGSIGFTFSPGTGPSVSTSYNSADRTILWKVKKYWFFGASLNNAMYPFGATWASSGQLAAINISTYVNFSDTHKSDWNEIQVRYYY